MCFAPPLRSLLCCCRRRHFYGLAGSQFCIVFSQLVTHGLTARGLLAALYSNGTGPLHGTPVCSIWLCLASQRQLAYAMPLTPVPPGPIVLQPPHLQPGGGMQHPGIPPGLNAAVLQQQLHQLQLQQQLGAGRPAPGPSAPINSQAQAQAQLMAMLGLHQQGALRPQ